MSRYACLSKQTFEEPPYALVPIRFVDMESIRVWRNRQIDLLRQQHPLTEEGQNRYWNEVFLPSFNSEKPEQLLFSYLFEGECIGYGGLTHIDWASERGEVSFLLDPRRTEDDASYKKEYIIFLRLLSKAVFDTLGFHRIFAETFDIRPAHIDALETFGFQREGRLQEHVKIRGKFYDSLIHGYVRKR